MKQKVIISGLCLTLALSLVGCGGQQAHEPQQTENVQPSEVVISEPPVEAQLLEVSTTTAPVEESQGLEDGDGSVDEAGSSESAEPVTQEVELFTEVNETVYATGTVNIRASWTADSEKLGSLGTGESVTRTGTGIVGTDADGWSRVSLADGTIAYISTSYLSTTKPVTQNSGSTTQQATQGGGTTQQTTQGGGGGGTQQSGGQSQEDQSRADPEAADYGLSAMLQYAEEHQGSGTALENRPGTTVDESGNFINPDAAVNMN